MKTSQPVRKKENALATVGRGIFVLLKGLVKLIWKAIVVFGLWIPLLYVLFGAVLHFALGFDPFDFSFYSTLYIIGGIVCVVISLIVSINHTFINPLKKVFGKKKTPKPVQDETLQPPLSSEATPAPPPPVDPALSARKDASTPPLRLSDLRSVPNYPGEEIPQVYFSVIYPDILVHEYKDRFELYRVEGARLVSAGTEFKDS